MVRLRTANQAWKEIKCLDPETGITEHHIRKIIKSGKLPIITQGVKVLVDMDALISYLENPECFERKEAPKRMTNKK